MNKRNLPLGIYLAWKLFKKDFSLREHRSLVLFLTFIAYACFHASRKPLSIVKSVLDPDGSNSVTDINPASHVGSLLAPSPAFNIPLIAGWPPFDGPLGVARLGEVDVAFLAAYAVGMYFAGRLGDRIDLRKFLAYGMVGSGAFVFLFGMGYWWNIHSFPYYFLVQIFTGLLSAIGWPSVVAVVGNWFGKTKRGLIMGIWNAHASVGNIAGSIVAASALRYGWGWSFVFPALAIIIFGVFIFLFLVVEPACLGLPSPHEVDQHNATLDDEERDFLMSVVHITAGLNVVTDIEDTSSIRNVEVPISFGVDWDIHESFDVMTLHKNLPSSCSLILSYYFKANWKLSGEHKPHAIALHDSIYDIKIFLHINLM